MFDNKASILTLVIAIVLIFYAANYAQKVQTENRNQLSSQGFNVNDVEIFIKGTDYTLEDFLKSPSLRKQYELFQDGNNEFMYKARLNKKANDAEDSAAFAVGMSAASVAISNSR